MPELGRKSIESFAGTGRHNTGFYVRIGDDIFFGDLDNPPAVLQEMRDNGKDGDVDHQGTFLAIAGTVYLTSSDRKKSLEDEKASVDKTVARWREIAGESGAKIEPPILFRQASPRGRMFRNLI